ncbi:alcohol dehydrogenase catalytic domain-containing protein [Nakamurella sp. YIM 132084]|uniref:Alcohol dehydrogenase catalytic domain-containing protein n=1 Tax=Nakamurella leprariae TaxID=2803911 RepID=A0A938YHC4_9ACTN|nr:alcohol dehydrogenase catalytic domain-containing protein [Nakamurella leprariae]
MKALVWQGPYSHEMQQIPAPSAGGSEILVRVGLVGICGSDVTAHKGLMGISRPGAVRGHEFGGTVEHSDDPRLPVGTRVSVNPVLSCGRCAACAAGRPPARRSRSSVCTGPAASASWSSFRPITCTRSPIRCPGKPPLPRSRWRRPGTMWNRPSGSGRWGSVCSSGPGRSASPC